MLAVLSEAFAEAGENPQVRVVVLAVNGPAYCAGHDLKEMTAGRVAADGGRACFAKVMSLLISAPEDMKAAGFEVTHLYGLTETYGPAVVNDWHRSWSDLPPAQQAALKARQGVRYLPLEQLDVMDADTMQSVPRDGQTMGEVMFR